MMNSRLFNLIGTKKNPIFIGMLILAAAITNSCTISTTTNKYYGYPYPSENPDSITENKKQCLADTLKAIDDGQNE